MGKKRRVVLWFNEQEHEYLHRLGEKELSTPAATLRRIVKTFRAREISSVHRLEELLDRRIRENDSDHT